MSASSSSQESTPTLLSAKEDESATLDVVPAAAPGSLQDLPGRTVGRYVVGSLVGSGAMGMVYRAFDPELERYVAIKVISPRTSNAELSRERMLREARALAKIEHPNVVTVHDVGVIDERVFIAMEFVEGGDLKQWLRVSPPEERRPWRDVLRKFIDAAEGLAAAHAAGLVHRDFKPANVLMREQGRVLVSDFGLVRESTSQVTAEGVSSNSSEVPGGGLTVTGSVLGTPAYMAPEQFRGGQADERSDQFAFCVALWEGLAGQRPFFPYGTSEMYVRIKKKPPRIPEDSVPVELYRLLQRGLSADPDHRYDGMQDLVDALRVHLETPRRGPGRGLLAVGLLAVAAAAGSLAIASAKSTPPRLAVATLRGLEDLDVPEPPVAEVSPQQQVKTLDLQAGPLEKAGVTGPDVASMQLKRALAHLAVYRAAGEPRHLQVAHELLVRTQANVYKHPDPGPLQSRAERVLAELYEQPKPLAKAGIELEPLSRYAITVLMRHGEGTHVLRQFPEPNQSRLVCVEPCTWAVPVGPKGGDAVRFELKGETVGMAGWNPQTPLAIHGHF